MMLRILLFLGFSIGMQAWAKEVVSYSGFKVVRLFPRTQSELNLMKILLETDATIDVWRPPTTVNIPVDLNLSPQQYDRVMVDINTGSIDIKQEMLIPDVQELIESDHKIQQTETGRGSEHSKYRTLEDINEWIDKMAKTYSSMVTVFTAANSSEDRPIRGLKILTDKGKSNKPGFYFQGGIHAREWISPATVIFMTAKMLQKYKKDKHIATMMDRYVWYIIPVANPDGYKYTWETDRMWRKTRSQQANGCVGVDPNRNWDFKWCTTGASKNPCSEIYCGQHAFSEPETAGISDFILKNIGRPRVFIDFHAYSQIWMSPWGYTTDLPPDHRLQDRASKKAVGALKKVNGKMFEHGSVANVLYKASGGSDDWAYGKAGFLFSFSVELRDKGRHGFLLPAKQIIPSGKETLQAVIELADFVYRKTEIIECECDQYKMKEEL